MDCPRCNRPVAVARAQCLYCGADVAPDAVVSAARAALSTPALPAAAPAADRALLIVALDGAAPAALERGLGLSAYEAAQWARRGGYHLLRALPASEGPPARDALAAHGLVAFAVPEAVVREGAEPELARGGAFEGGTLSVETAGARAVTVAGRDLLLIVKGPIAREYAASADRLRFTKTATLEPGFRFHLHRRGHARALEIDPAGFDFGAHRATESSLLELGGWMSALAGDAPVDDGFRRLTPAFAPAADAIASGDRVERALRAPAARKDAILDNLSQFRHYSAWRGAVERALRG